MTRLGARALAAPLAWFACFACSSIASAAPPTGRAERCVAAAERGQQERDRAAFAEARVSFRACAAEECPALVRKDCAQWLADVEVNTPTVVLGAKDAHGNDMLGAHIFVDGKSYQEEVDSGRAIALNPGPHVFRFEHSPDAPVELTEVLRMGEHNRPIYGTFSAALPPAPAPTAAQPPPVPAPPPAAAPVPLAKHVSTWAYVFGAAAVVGGASFAYFGATGLSEKSQLRSQCGDTCTDAQVQPLKVKYITADVSLGLGVIAAAVSAWLFLHPKVEEGTEPATTVTIAPNKEGASLSIVGTF
ncbi:MAG: hypothetical protein ACLQVI_43800 [Polyangiaceae bacterium]|jgi:hypothetical protein